MTQGGLENGVPGCLLTFRWSVFGLVDEKCVTRYSGHLFSHLAVRVHQYDQTDGVSFSMRGNLGRPFRVNIFYDVWSTSVVTTFCCNVRLLRFLTPKIYLYGCLKFIGRYISFLYSRDGFGLHFLNIFCKLHPSGWGEANLFSGGNPI